MKMIATAFFIIGVVTSTLVSDLVRLYDEMDCGGMKGYTLHTVKEYDDLICVWRQDSYPFKTISGRKV